MTFTVPRKPLLDELALLTAITREKATIPVLQTVMLGLVADVLTLTATNLDATLVTEISVTGDSWSGCLPCNQLYALVKLLDGDNVEFRPSEGRVEVRCGRARHKLPLLSVREFPEIHRVDGDGVTVNLDVLSRAVSAVEFAMLKPSDGVKAQDHKYTGLSIRGLEGRLEVMATMKTVTGVAEMDGECPQVILPRMAVTALSKLSGEATLKVDRGHAEFTTPTRTLIARTLDGEFPAWRTFLPEPLWQLIAPKDELVGAIRRATLTTAVDNAVGYEPMKLTATTDELVVSTRGGRNGESADTVAITANFHEPFAIGFIGAQVLDVLGKFNGEVRCELHAPTQPMVFKREDGGLMLTYIVMPVGLRGW